MWCSLERPQAAGCRLQAESGCRLQEASGRIGEGAGLELELYTELVRASLGPLLICTDVRYLHHRAGTPRRKSTLALSYAWPVRAHDAEESRDAGELLAHVPLACVRIT